MVIDNHEILDSQSIPDSHDIPHNREVLIWGEPSALRAEHVVFKLSNSAKRNTLAKRQAPSHRLLKLV